MEEQTNLFADPVPVLKWEELFNTVQQQGGVLKQYGASTSPIGKDLQSPNFQDGVKGWKLSSSGSAQFNEGIETDHIDIPDTTTANSFHVDTTGNAWWGATTLASAVAYIKNDGKFFIGDGTSSIDWDVTTADTLTVKGTINATAGYVGASTAIIYESTGLNVGTTGHIRGGQTDFATGTGFFLGYTSGAYKFSVGNPSGEYITWDGSGLTINGVQKIVRSFTAGEGITVTVPVPVFIGTAEFDTLIDTGAGAGAKDNIGENVNREKEAQSFQFSASTTINYLKLQLAKFGSPTDNLIISIQTDDSNKPSGTILASATIAGSSLGAMAEVSMALSSSITLSASTKYWIVASRSGALNGSNYYEWGGNNSGSTYADGVAFTYNVGSWVAAAAIYDFQAKIGILTANTKVYVSDANNATRDTFIGFVQSTVLMDASTSVVLVGIVSGFTGLTPNSTYYVQNTIGTIGTTPGSTSIPVGVAISTTEILIDRT